MAKKKPAITAIFAGKTVSDLEETIMETGRLLEAGQMPSTEGVARARALQRWIDESPLSEGKKIGYLIWLGAGVVAKVISRTDDFSFREH